MAATIRVDTQMLMSYTRSLQGIARRLYNIQWELSALYEETHIPGLSTIANRRQVSQCADAMLTYGQWCMDVFQDFQRVEEYLLKQDPESFARLTGSAIAIYSGNNADNMRRQAVGDIKNVIGAVGKIKNDSQLKQAKTGISYVQQIEEAMRSDTPRDQIIEYAALMGISPDVLQAVYEKELSKLPGWNQDLSKISPNSAAGKFMAKYETGMNRLGLAGSVIGAGATVWRGSIGKSVPEVLLGAHEMVGPGSGIAIAAQKLSPDRITGDFEAECHNLAGVGAVISMTTTGIGDFCLAYEDGKYTYNELGNTFIKSGLAGASSLASTYTLGLVNIDVDKAHSTFQENITIAQDFINASTDDVGLRVAMSVPGTIMVSAVSAAEVAADTVVDTAKNFYNMGVQAVEFGKSIGESFMSWLKW